MPETVPFNLPFDEAIEYFQGKGFAVSPESWRDVWLDANARSFTVARVTAMDVLHDLKNEIGKALKAGVSLEDFKKNLVPTLERKGWFAPKGEAAKVELPDGTIRKRLTPWRLELIYRTNIQTAYMVGRYKQMTDPDVTEIRPYWQYKAILDRRTRPEHAAMHDKVYDWRHPIWNTWYPPNGFRCRCYVKTLSERQMEARGLEASIDPPGAMQPDEGWRYNVGEAGFLHQWDNKAALPDALPLERVAGGRVRITPGQKTWRDYQRPDLRDVGDQERQPAQDILPGGGSKEEALVLLRTALGLTDGSVRTVATPIEPVLISDRQLLHLVEKRRDARERYANFIVPTLENPYEVYMTEYEDGVRSRYIGLFSGTNDVMAVVRVNKDGSLLWNIMQGKDKDMNKNRIGTLVWTK